MTPEHIWGHRPHTERDRLGNAHMSLGAAGMANIGNDTAGFTPLRLARTPLGVVGDEYESETAAAEPGAVKLSIVMPAYNEVATIRTAIERILAIDFPCAVELIVVNDGSVDGTAAEIMFQRQRHALAAERVFRAVLFL